MHSVHGSSFEGKIDIYLPDFLAGGLAANGDADGGARGMGNLPTWVASNGHMLPVSTIVNLLVEESDEDSL